MSLPARPHAVAALPWPPPSRLFRFAPLAGAAGGALAVSALGFGGGLIACAGRAETADRVRLARAADAALLAVPGVLVVYLSFSGGGFFPDSVAVATLALALLLALRCSLAA